jgi:hypothetical protein
VPRRPPKVVDKGYTLAVRRLSTLNGIGVSVGVPDVERADGTSMVDVAVGNEFGTENAPARSFMRSTFEEQKENLTTLNRMLTKLVSLGKITQNEAAETVGEFMRDRIQEKIIELDFPPNAPSTVARKGFDDPLRDTDQLLNAITFWKTRRRK